MSVDYRGLVDSPDDPMLQLVLEMAKRVAKSIKDQAVELLDSDNEDIYSDGQDVDAVVRYHSELSGQHHFLQDRTYRAPFEPDGNTVTLWLRGTNLGDSLFDTSRFLTASLGSNHAAMYGDPTLVDGIIDLGYQTYGTKSIALRLNRPTSTQENKEWLECFDDASLQFTAFATGFSLFIRVRFLSLAQQGGRDATVFEKIDDSVPNNAVMLQAKSDGRLVFIMLKGGVTTAKQTATETIDINTVYDIFLTWTVSGSAMKIYINGVDKTLTNFTGALNWQDDLLNHDLFIGRRGAKSLEGMCYMDFYDFKLYRNRIVTQTEVTNHWLNKWSISAIGFGKVMLTNYWATGSQIIDGSFSSGSFSPGSFSTYP